MRIKALSFRQPWAELVLQGRKTLDLRSWSTRHRGLLAIFASQTVEKEACLKHGMDPDRLTTGAVIGLVDLINVVELDQAAYASRESEHLGGRPFQKPLFGWELADPQPLTDPLPARGRQLLFDVDLPVSDNQPARVSARFETQPPVSTASDTDPFWNNSAPFEMRLIPEPDGKSNQPAYRLGIYQRKLEPAAAQQSLYVQPPKQMEPVVELGGTNLRAVADQVLETLRANGYKATDLNAARREPFALCEESGVRLALLFMAAKPVSKISRIEEISSGIRQMTSEEIYYWYSKCTSRMHSQRAQKALRMLLAEE